MIATAYHASATHREASVILGAIALGATELKGKAAKAARASRRAREQQERNAVSLERAAAEVELEVASVAGVLNATPVGDGSGAAAAGSGGECA